MRALRSILFAAATALAVAGAMSLQCSVVWADFGPAVVITPDGCRDGKFTLGRDRVPRGYASCADSTVLYLEKPGSTWTRRDTGLTGSVLATADDGTTSYVLLRMGDDVTVARRTHGGRQFPARSLGPAHAAEAGLVARDGKWWAVWRAYFPPGSEPDHLWQAGTLFGSHPPEQVSSGVATDMHPALAIGPGGRVVLAWNRFSGDTSTIRLASTNNGQWTSRQLSDGKQAVDVALVGDSEGIAAAWSSPQGIRIGQVFANGGRRSLTWQAGRLLEHGLALGGGSRAPRVGAVAYRQPSYRELVGRWTGQRWDVDDVTAPRSYSTELVGIAAVLHGGSATTVVLNDIRDNDPDPANYEDTSRLWARTSA